MMEINSIVLSAAVQASLVQVAAQRQITTARLLEEIVVEWLDQQDPSLAEAGQEALHQAAAQSFGKIRGQDPGRSQQVRQRVRERLQGQYESSRID